MVHANCKLRLIGSEVEFLSLFELTLRLKLLPLLHIEIHDVTLWEILTGYLQCLFPLTCPCIHLECIDWLISLNEILLSEVVLPYFFIVLCYLLVVGSSHFGRLHTK